MQHASYRHSSSTPRQRPDKPIRGFEKFAVRFAEAALLLGVVGAGIALLVSRTG